MIGIPEEETLKLLFYMNPILEGLALLIHLWRFIVEFGVIFIIVRV